jgi:hypothetical protein
MSPIQELPDPEDGGTALLQNVSNNQSTHDNIPEDLKLHQHSDLTWNIFEYFCHCPLEAILNDRGHAREDHSDGHLKEDRIVLVVTSRHGTQHRIMKFLSANYYSPDN